MEMRKIKCAIVDDSAVQRKALAEMIKKHPSLKLLACFRNGVEAKKNYAAKDIDLMFLDIEMPLMNGFDLLESLDKRTQVIIVSSKSEYALRAFEYKVTDYLLKPIDPNRFERAVQRVLRNSHTAFNKKDNSGLFVKSDYRQVKIVYSDIKWVEALGDYIKLVTKNANHIVLSSMKAFERKLPDEQFLRIHKSYIINLKKVENLNHAAVEIEGKKVPISRKRKEKLMNALGF